MCVRASEGQASRDAELPLVPCFGGRVVATAAPGRGYSYSHGHLAAHYLPTPRRAGCKRQIPPPVGPPRRQDHLRGGSGNQGLRRSWDLSNGIHGSV